MYETNYIMYRRSILQEKYRYVYLHRHM